MTYKPEKGSRQPVVLYDKDNTAIDVSGIEELSSIKIDTGEIAGDLKLVKDNQGRLYGKYGESWIPVKVDSEGRPIIASDVTVNAEGMVVDLGQIKQGPAGTEPWPVQLSGTVVTLYGGSTPAIEPGQELEVLRQKIPNNVGRLKLAIAGPTAGVQAMEVTIRTALADGHLGYSTSSFWQTVEKPYNSESWKELGGNSRSKIIDTFGDWVKVSIKNTSTTTPYDVRFYVGGAQ